jgi:hypothetical protein
MLHLLITDPEVREAAGHAAKQRIREQYLWPKIAQQVEEAYMEMMGWPALAPIASPIPAGAPVRAQQEGGRKRSTVIPIPVSGTTRRAA